MKSLTNFCGDRKMLRTFHLRCFSWGHKTYNVKYIDVKRANEKCTKCDNIFEMNRHVILQPLHDNPMFEFSNFFGKAIKWTHFGCPLSWKHSLKKNCFKRMTMNCAFGRTFPTIYYEHNPKWNAENASNLQYVAHVSGNRPFHWATLCTVDNKCDVKLSTLFTPSWIFEADWKYVVQSEMRCMMKWQPCADIHVY